MSMNIIEQVLNEVQRATTKYPTWPTDPLHALAVLGEEFGELNKAMLQLTYEPHKTSAAAVREEAIQTAAMALRLAMSLDRYEYRRCQQHSQGEADLAREPCPCCNPTGVFRYGDERCKLCNGTAYLPCTDSSRSQDNQG